VPHLKRGADHEPQLTGPALDGLVSPVRGSPSPAGCWLMRVPSCPFIDRGDRGTFVATRTLPARWGTETAVTRKNKFI
jgi:hypothetical protein